MFVGNFLANYNTHRALYNGLGWAIFNDEAEGALAELGSREVLLLSRIAMGINKGKIFVPSVRIITNESIMGSDHKTFISEDITVMPDVAAAYCLSALDIVPNDAKQQEGAVKVSNTPLFFAHNGGLALAGNSSVSDTTPVPPVNCDLDPSKVVHPFGNPYGKIDQFYALEKARKILSSIVNLVPEYQFER